LQWAVTIKPQSYAIQNNNAVRLHEVRLQLNVNRVCNTSAWHSFE